MVNTQQTSLERLDPRIKLIALLLLVPQILLTTNSMQQIGCGFFVLLAIVLSPISILTAVTQLRRILWFVVFITGINAATASGNVIFHIFGVYFTEEGLRDGVVLSARIAALLLLSFAFIRTTTIADIVESIETLLSPFRRRVGALVTVFGLTLNFVPLLVQSAQRITMAQRARGADIDSSFFRQLRFASQAALPLFVSAFRSSHHLADAMDARCYNTAAHRSSMSVRSLGWRDWATIILVALLWFLPLLIRQTG